MASARAWPPSAAGGSSSAAAPAAESACPPEPTTPSRPEACPEEAAARVVRLKRRPEFLAVRAAGTKWVAGPFVLQAGPRPGPQAEREIGLGFTVSRRVGKAVARNRARRRLVEAARAVLPGDAPPGFNYVIVARQAALTCPFDRLLEELKAAFARIHRRRPRASRAARGRPPSR